MNYFVEGLQGSGKSTLVGKLSGIHPDHKVFREGDYSPIELAWCAYVNKETYNEVLEKYNDIAFLADLMGHESIETTRIYLRRTATEQQQLVDKIVTW